MIADSLGEFGAGRSILIDGDNQIIAGHGVAEAAAHKGITDVQVIEADGKSIIAVRRADLTPEQTRRLALFDNRTTDLSEWDAEALDALREADGEILAGLFDEKEQQKLFAVLADGLALEDGADAEVAPDGDAPPSSIRMVQIFLTNDNYPEWAAAIEQLKTVFETTDLTTTVVEAVKYAEHHSR